MSESVRYLVSLTDRKCDLFVDADPSVYGDMEKLFEGAHAADDSKLFVSKALPGGGGSFTLNTKAIRSVTGTSYQRKALAKAVDLFGDAADLMPEDEDAPLRVVMSSDVLYDGTRLPMGAEVRWPPVEDELMQDITTKVMRRFARDIYYARIDNGYGYKKLIDGLVYARVHRPDGVTLETNPLGSCSLDTNGSWYDPAEEKAELLAHNLYAPDQQLICLAGLAAFSSGNRVPRP